MYVRMTKQLIEDAVNYVYRLRESELHKVNSEYGSIKLDEFQITGDEPYMEQLCWQGYGEQARALPTNWFRRSSVFKANIRLTDSQLEAITDFRGAVRTTNEPGTGRLLLRAVLRTPKEISHSADAAVSQYSSSEPVPTLDGELFPQIDQATRAARAYRAVSEKWNAVIDQVRAYLNSHKSLNTAIRELPSLRVYIPVKYLEELDKPDVKRTPKPKAAPVEPVDNEPVDKSLLAATALQIRLASSNQ